MIFFVRRYILVCILIVKPEYGKSQVSAYIASALCILAYIFNYHPFNSRFANLIEIFNELTVLSMGYLNLTYTDFLDDKKLIFDIGWLQLVIVCFNLLVNTTFIVVDILKGFYRKMKECQYNAWRKKQQIEMTTSMAVKELPVNSIGLRLPKEESKQ